VLPSDPSSSRLMDKSELCYWNNPTTSWLQDYEHMNISPRLDNAQQSNNSTITHQHLLYIIIIIIISSSCLSHQYHHNITSCLSH